MNKFLLGLFCLALLACGGGGGGSSAPVVVTPPALAMPAGIYYGTDLSATTGSGYPVIAALDPTGNFRVAEIDTTGVGCFGGLLVAGPTSFSSSAQHFNSPAYPGASTPITLGPGLVTSMPWNNGVQSGTVTLTADPIYNQSPTLASLAGAYSSGPTQNNVGVTMNVTLNADGTFSGSDYYGAFTGTLTQITPGKNLYKVNLVVTGGPSFTGVAFYSWQSANFTWNSWYMQINCPTYGMTAILSFHT